jgi:hypothetical protein
MQSAGSVLIVMVGLIGLYILISGKADAAVATWRAATTGKVQPAPGATPASATPPFGLANPSGTSNPLTLGALGNL